jgi:hypothetical protein
MPRVERIGAQKYLIFLMMVLKTSRATIYRMPVA